MKRLVCYGDSNTYGYDAQDIFGGPLPPEQRWTVQLGKLLGVEAVNCGLNGRTVPRWQRESEADLRLIVRHAPFDLLLIMLGTNDVCLGFDTADTASRMRLLLRTLRERITGCRVLLIAPPDVNCIEAAEPYAFETLAEHYKRIAEELDCYYLNLAGTEIDLAADGVHFSPEGHRQLAQILAETISSIIATKNP